MARSLRLKPDSAASKELTRLAEGWRREMHRFGEVQTALDAAKLELIESKADVVMWKWVAGVIAAALLGALAKLLVK